MTTAILPRHHIVATRQARHRRVVLVTRNPAVRTKLIRTLTRKAQLSPISKSDDLYPAQRVRPVIPITHIYVRHLVVHDIDIVPQHGTPKLSNILSQSTHQRVISSSAREHIIPGTAYNVIVRTVARSRKASLRQAQRLHVVSQRIASSPADHRVIASIGRLHDHRPTHVHHIGVVTGSTINRHRRVTLNRHLVITPTKRHIIHTLNPDVVCPVTQRQRVVACSQINKHLALRIHKPQLLIPGPTRQAHCRDRHRIDIISLAVDAIVRTVLIVRCPTHHETTHGKRRHPRLKLVARCIGVHPELFTHPGTARIIALGVDPIAATILVVR